METLPNDFWPANPTSNKERFSNWWRRVAHRVPNVPRNVAKQWLYPYQGLTSFRWIPLARCRFTLSRWSRDQVLLIRYDDEQAGISPSEERQGEWHLSQRGIHRNWLARVMERRGTWPMPPIVLDNRRPAQGERFGELHRGFVLVEGHSRLSIARALARRGGLADEHCIWLLTIAPETDKIP